MTISNGVFLETEPQLIGATATLNGVSGFVPAPLAGEQMLFLRGDGIWAPASGGGGSTWNVITTDTSMVAQNNYITNNTSTITLTLPTTASIGTTFKIVGSGTANWEVAQNSGQTIYMGTVSSATGSGGSASSTNPSDAIELVCISANSGWRVASSIGTISFT